MQRGTDRRAGRGRGFVDVRDPKTRHLLCKYDPDRRVVQIRARGVTHEVELDKVEDGAVLLTPAETGLQ